MQENNFEKHVQQKIDELKLTPSDEVWQKLAVVIAKRKGDRRRFAILFLFLLFIGSSVFIIWNRVSGRKIDKEISEKNGLYRANSLKEITNDSNEHQIVGGANSPETVKKDRQTDRISIINDIAGTKKIGNQLKPEAIKEPLKITVPGLVEKQVESSNKIAGINNARDKVHNNTGRLRYQTSHKLSVAVSNGIPGDLSVDRSGASDPGKPGVEEIVPAKIDEAEKRQVIDPMGRDRIEIEKLVGDSIVLISATADKRDASLKKSVQLKQKNGWKPVLNFSLGVTATQNGLLGIIGSGSSDEDKAFADMSQSTGNNAGQGSYISHVPTEIKAGTGLVLGMFLQKDISSKTNLRVGFNYRSYNSVMMVGNRVDSVNNFSRNDFIYRSGNINRYKNHFHFLELPLVVRFKLGTQNKVPVYLNTSISISRLVGSNALQFDTLTGTYYMNNALFNKTLFNFSAGLLFSLSGHVKNPILIGPDMNFSLNNMAKTGLYQNHHYSYFGILVQKSMGKK